LTTVRQPMRFSKSRLQYRDGPPALGQHTDEVLTTVLNVAPSQMLALRTQGVIR
jgi:crotonobetainyl-CoA:carnitine CoA-transferase CaiB-like acyl-CoA transferase